MSKKDIKIKSKNSVYTGNVKITLYSGKTPYKTIVQHNYGTASFFEYILKATAGYDVTSRRPAYVVLCSDKEGAMPIVSYGVLSEGLPEISVLENKEDPSNSSCSMTYSFLVPSTVVQNKIIGSLILRSLDRVSDYAILSLTDDVEIGTNENMLVDWTLTISNNYGFNSQETV